MSQALDLNPKFSQALAFRSKVHSKLAMHEEAVRDADALILIEREMEKKNPALKLCEGYKARADALYAAGEFERALLDYCNCCDNHKAAEY